MTLLAVRTSVANMLTRSDLDAEITSEIQNAIREYNRTPFYLTEKRAGTINLTAGTTWYSTLDLTSAAGPETFTTATPIGDIQEIIHAKIEYGTLDEPMCEVPYYTMERYLENADTAGVPAWFARFAGQIGVYPIPDTTYTMQISVLVKGLVPSADGDTSVWFNEARELIECCAAKKVCMKYLQDVERAQVFAALEADQRNAVMRENINRQATGRIRARE